MADAQGHRTCGGQSIQEDSGARARAAPGLERQPLLPCVQMLFWRVAPRLCAAPAHRGGPGTDADDGRASQLDRRNLRHVRSAALHTFIPTHCRPAAVRVAPHSAWLALRARRTQTNAGKCNPGMRFWKSMILSARPQERSKQSQLQDRRKSLRVLTSDDSQERNDEQCSGCLDV